MKILITNNDLSTRSGSELYAKDVAEELMKRGHTVAAYSSQIGELAKIMNQSGIQTIDDLSELSWIPDIIHGQHHLETMTAVAHFPNIPAIYLCHGWRPWQEKPPFHPRIMEYAAVDSMTLDFAVKQCGVPQGKIRLIHNFADLDRFKQRGSLPEKPKKALVFNNVANNDNYLPVVRKACNRSVITLDSLGISSGRATSQPENFLKNYDLIFAVGRSALEALATGSAVIICGDFGVGPMVTLKDMDRLYDCNFGTAAMHSKHDADAIYREICKYDAEDSAELTKNLRAIMGIGPAVDKLEKFYAEAIEKYKNSNIHPEDEAHALSVYLKETAIFLKKTFSDLHQKNLILLDIKSLKVSKFRDIYKKIKRL